MTAPETSRSSPPKRAHNLSAAKVIPDSYFIQFTRNKEWLCRNGEGEGEARDGTFAHGQGYDLECDPTEPSQHLTACSLATGTLQTFARSYWTIRVSGHLVRCPRQDIGLREESERTRTAPPPFRYNFSSPKVIASEQASERASAVFVLRTLPPPSKSPFLGPAFRPHLPLPFPLPSIYAGGDHKCGGRFGQFSPYAAPAVSPHWSGERKSGKKLAISSSLLVRCRSGEKRGRCKREQIAANASSVCNTPRNALPSPLLLPLPLPGPLLLQHALSTLLPAPMVWFAASIENAAASLTNDGDGEQRGHPSSVQPLLLESRTVREEDLT